MIRSQIEFEVREPTGLSLGTYDVFMIRQKLYTGELKPRCEFLDERGSWTPLGQHPRFAEVIWLLGETKDRPSLAEKAPEQPKMMRSTLVSTSSAPTAPLPRRSAPTAPVPKAPAPKPDAASEKKKQKGLLGRFFGRS